MCLSPCSFLGSGGMGGDGNEGSSDGRERDGMVGVCVCVQPGIF